MLIRLSCKIYVCLLVMMGPGAGCDPGENMAPDASPDAAADAGPVAQGSPAQGDLIVNEVAPQPVTGPDWIELYNRSGMSLDLCGFFVTDALDRLDHYAALAGVYPPDPCPATLVEPGAYLMVYADDNALSGPDHAPFKLGVADEVHVVTTQGAVVDSLVYLHPGGGQGMSLARQPNGEGLFYLAEPTPNEENPSMENMP